MNAAMSMALPIISENIWGDEPTESYYTVYVYRHNGMGSEATYTNILATSADEATKRVAGTSPWLRHNPMVAYVQASRV